MKAKIALVCGLVVVIVVLLVAFLIQPPQSEPADFPSPNASFSATPAPSASSTESAAADELPSSDNADDFVVADFPRPGVFFVSSSKNLRCGILVDEPETGAGLGRWGCLSRGRSWEVAYEKPGDPCFEPALPSCGAGIEATAHGIPGPMMRATVDDSYASLETVDDGNGGFEVRTLAAGESVTYAGVTCSAAANNLITCTDDSTGHGFSISSTVYEIV